MKTLLSFGMVLLLGLPVMVPSHAGAAQDLPEYKDVKLETLGITPVEVKKDPKTGFIVGGKNDTALIRKLNQINGLPIAKLEKAMRPGQMSRAGFLGKEESLLEVLANDNRFVVEELGLTHQELAHHLHALGAIGKKSKDFTYHGRKFKVLTVSFRGFMDSPFDDDTVTNTAARVFNLDNGKVLNFSLLVPFMVERYGFYEGKGTEYRVDPRQILEVLDFLKPKTKQAIEVAPTPPAEKLKQLTILKGLPDKITALALTSDRKTLVIRSGEKGVLFWDVPGNCERCKLQAPGGQNVPVALSRDGKVLALAGEKSVSLFDLPTGKFKETLTDIAGKVAFTEAGKEIAYPRHSQSKEETRTEIQVLDLATRKDQTIFKRYEKTFLPDPTLLGTFLAFSADNKILAVGKTFVGDFTQSVSLIDLASGKETKTLWLNGQAQIDAAAFSNDNFLAVLGPAGLQLWDCSQGNLRATFQGPFSHPSLAPDARTVASVGPDNSVILWEIPFTFSARAPFQLP